VFSGDDDSICSTSGTQDWIWGLGVEATRMWKAWKVEEQTAGFVTHFDLGDQTDATFLFVTVHRAGHEVPAYRPVEALALFRNYFSGEW
jgi:carboxypeptidase C (cathepsin A)